MPRPKIDTQLQLIDTKQDMEENRVEPRDIAYLVREMLLCTLPHRDPKSHFYSREMKDSVLMIQSGMNKKGVHYGIPFGTLPRLLLYWLVTEVKRTGSRQIQLKGKNENAESFAAFMRELGLDTSRGGERSDHVRLKDAMLRLFNARVAVYGNRIEINKWYTSPVDIFAVSSKQRIWWDRDTEALAAPSWIELGQELFDAICKSVVPADLRALRQLKHSPLAMDLYGILNYFGATLTLTKAKDPRTVTWRELQQRLGTQYTDIGNFRHAVKGVLADVFAVHPGLRVELPEAGGGLRVYASEPAVPFRLEDAG